MKKLLLVILKYLYTGNTNIIEVEKLYSGETYQGIQLIVLEYEVFGIFDISVTKRVFWKPFKKIISEETLPNLTENNKKGKDPYVNIWFELEEEMEKFNLFSVKLLSKVKLNSSMNYVLNNLFEKTKKAQNE